MPTFIAESGVEANGRIDLVKIACFNQVMTKLKPTLNQADRDWLRKNFLTKEDGKNFLTRSDDDIKALKGLISVTIDEKIEEKQLVTKDDISHLPTKTEFFDRMDEVMGELKKIRENTNVLSQHSQDHSDDLEKLKEIHPDFEHA